MARLNLVTMPAFGIRYQHPSDRTGIDTVIPTYRIGITLFVAPRTSPHKWTPFDQLDLPPQFDAILDTGAPLTIIPHSFWQAFEDEIEILAQPSAESELHIAGGAQNGQLGRLRLGAMDTDRHWMPAEWTLALFLDAPDPASNSGPSLNVPLLGLHSHFLTNHRRVRHVGYFESELLATVPQWCLEDRSKLWPW